MSSYRKTIFIAPPEVGKVTGRYICPLRVETEDENRYFAEDSIVELARVLGNKEDDWSYVERELLEKGIFSV